MLGLVRHVRPGVLHLGDRRLRIVRMVQSSFDPFFFRFRSPRQVGTRRYLHPRRLRELRQRILIALAPVVTFDAGERRFRPPASSRRCRRSCSSPTASASRSQHPSEDRFVRLQTDQPTHAGDRRLVGRPLRQHQTRATRAGRTNRRGVTQSRARRPSLRKGDQQQPEVAARRQAGSALIRVESLARALDESVEVVLVEDLIQSRVEQMDGTPRQVFGRHPHRRLLRMPPSSFVHRHRRAVVRKNHRCRSRFDVSRMTRRGPVCR